MGRQLGPDFKHSVASNLYVDIERRWPDRLTLHDLRQAQQVLQNWMAVLQRERSPFEFDAPPRRP